LIAAPPTAPVLVPEGEKCVEALVKLGFVTTCNPGGADNGNGGKWTTDLNRWFAGRNVVLMPDNDVPGRKHVEHVAKQLQGIAASIKVLDLAEHWPGPDPMGKGDDIVEWLEFDRAGSRLAQLVKDAPTWQPPSAGESAGASDDELIDELAGLSPLAYAKRRKAAAKKIGIPVGDLDREVKGARPKPEPDDSDGKRRRAFQFPEFEAWPEPVDGDALLLAVKAKIRRHVAADDALITAATLWVVFAWTHDAHVHSPILLITSKEPDSGKTTTIELIKYMVPRGTSSVEITAAVLYRMLEKYQPTFVIDEADEVFKDRDDLRSVINSGWTRGQGIWRCNPVTLEPEYFPTFAPKAISMKGLKVPRTTLTRSVILELKRKLCTEIVEDFDYQDSAELKQFRGQFARWTRDNIDHLRDVRPDVPEGFYNRLACNWRPLFAIADRCGGEWPAKARAAARALTKRESASRYVEALIAIKGMFDARTGPDKDRMFSKDIVKELLAIEDGPWQLYSGRDYDKPITQKTLGTLLDPIKSKTVWIEGVSLRGYTRDQFEDDFRRYLDPGPAPEEASEASPHPLPPIEVSKYQNGRESGVSGAFEVSEPDPGLTDRNRKKLDNDAGSHTLTLREGEGGQGEHDAVATKRFEDEL
jgi:Protein of unknown function (DUF3631)